MNKKKHLSVREIADLRRTSVIKFLDEIKQSNKGAFEYGQITCYTVIEESR